METRQTARAGRQLHEPQGIQMTIMITFMVVSIVSLTFVSVVLYSRFASTARETTLSNTQSSVEQTQATLEDYLLSMRQISDAVYYNVITETDISDASLGQEMSLIYESYRDRLVSIALYDDSGTLLNAAPVVAEKASSNPARQEWFAEALAEIENVHFGVPHVQNLFEDERQGYTWVISLSRAVDVTDGNRIRMGVLLVDMSFSSIAQIMDQINETENGQYYYLCDNNGNLIYHPRKVLISEGMAEENTDYVAGLTDGTYEDELGGERRSVVVRSISYTGWRLVGVIPESAYASSSLNLQYFVVLVTIIVAMLLMAVNRLVSGRISRPILQLDDSVKAHEAGGALEIANTGPAEIQHLGHSIQRSYQQIEELMDQIVLEQNERRRSEFDALQSQINPHFLYNTLDSITWMVEGGRNDDAAYMISELGRLLRISLSKGHTIISLRDELQHCRSYMNIQRIRYRDRFSVRYDVPEEILDYCCVKLVMQPILENAIYYGVGSMDTDDDGEIVVTGRLVPDDLLGTAACGVDCGTEDPVLADNGTAGSGPTNCHIEIIIADNGLGMESEEAAQILTKGNTVPKHGSGVGLVNVNSRLRIVFGKGYGLQVESEPDCGMKVTIRIPALPFNEENRDRLEHGRAPAGKAGTDEA